jgi:hypothetical protein
MYDMVSVNGVHTLLSWKAVVVVVLSKKGEKDKIESLLHLDFEKLSSSHNFSQFLQNK